MKPTKKIDLKAQMRANRKSAKVRNMMRDAQERQIARAMDVADEYLATLAVTPDPVAIACAAACVMVGGDGVTVMVARGVCDEATAKAAIADAQTANLFTLDERLTDAAKLPRREREVAVLCAVDLIQPKTVEDMARLELVAGALGFSAMRYVD